MQFRIEEKIGGWIWEGYTIDEMGNDVVKAMSIREYETKDECLKNFHEVCGGICSLTPLTINFDPKQRRFDVKFGETVVEGAKG